MIDNADGSWLVLANCAGWEIHEFAMGPTARLLMHVVADAAGQLRGDGGCSARASARLVLRNGTIFGVVASAPREAMLAVLLAVGVALAGKRYDESDFSDINAALASALLAAGQQRARVELEHNATVLARPLLTANQLGRLALTAVNAMRIEHAEPALPDLATCLADRLLLACSFDDPAVQAYRAALDPYAAAFPGAARTVHGIALDRLCVYNFLAATGIKSRNRVQAMVALPWLLPMMTAPGSGRILFEVVSIRQAIDDGLPLFDAVARAFGVPREVVRWLGRRTLPLNWGMDVDRIRQLLALLSWMPPERRPQSDAQFAALTALGSALAAALDFADANGKAAPLERYAPCMRRWLAQVTKPGLVAATAAPGFQQLSSDLADARDFLRALFEAIQGKDSSDLEAAEEQVLRWCAGIQVRRLLTLSREWHTELVAETPDAADHGAGSRWPAVLACPWQHEQVTVIELTSSTQLRTEGQVMQHCVGSYDDFCRSGNSLIVSLRAASGKHLSTAELHLGDGVHGVVAGQHRGARNAVPSAECARALAALVDHLNRPGKREALRQRQDFQRKSDGRRRVLLADGRAGQGAFSRTAQQAAVRLAFGEGRPHEDARRDRNTNTRK